MRKRSGIPMLAVLVVLAAILTACAPVTDGLVSALGQSTAAVRSAGLSLALLRDERSTTSATGTLVDDMLGEAQDAEKSVVELSPSSDGERRSRDAVLTLVHEATVTM